MERILLISPLIVRASCTERDTLLAGDYDYAVENKIALTPVKMIKGLMFVMDVTHL